MKPSRKKRLAALGAYLKGLSQAFHAGIIDSGSGLIRNLPKIGKMSTQYGNTGIAQTQIKMAEEAIREGHKLWKEANQLSREELNR
ncbi:MAG: hypothetical protein WBM32_12770 [Crocosphaera sp.]